MKAKHAVARTREHAEELAWRPWARIGPGVVDKGLALRDDRGTWWEMATRTLVGSIVEDTRVAVVG
ncbi:MAG: hypothetical protein QOG75_4141 [Mycobacterium sp.]|jgi:hypothetical protein|nr:hypothetical protein [Mycobacterium sp.]